MKKQWLSLVMAMFFVVGLPFVMFVDTASAQVDCKKNPEQCKGTPCSPGFWKNHADAFNAWCDLAADQTADPRLDSCAELAAAVSCKGADATCLRSVAAALLNSVSGCQE